MLRSVWGGQPGNFSLVTNPLEGSSWQKIKGVRNINKLIHRPVSRSYVAYLSKMHLPSLSVKLPVTEKLLLEQHISLDDYMSGLVYIRVR